MVPAAGRAQRASIRKSWSDISNSHSYRRCTRTSAPGFPGSTARPMTVTLDSRRRLTTMTSRPYEGCRGSTTIAFAGLRRRLSKPRAHQTDLEHPLIDAQAGVHLVMRCCRTPPHARIGTVAAAWVALLLQLGCLLLQNAARERVGIGVVGACGGKRVFEACCIVAVGQFQDGRR